MEHAKIEGEHRHHEQVEDGEDGPVDVHERS